MSGSPDNLSQIRDILVGSELASLHETIHAVDIRLQQLIEGFKKDLETAIEGLHDLIGQQHQQQSDRIIAIESMIDQLENRQAESSNHFTQQVEELRNQMTAQFEELTKTHQAHTESLMERLNAIDNNKPDRETIASLLESLASSLRAYPQSGIEVQTSSSNE